MDDLGKPSDYALHSNFAIPPYDDIQHIEEKKSIKKFIVMQNISRPWVSHHLWHQKNVYKRWTPQWQQVVKKSSQLLNRWKKPTRYMVGDKQSMLHFTTKSYTHAHTPL